MTVRLGLIGCGRAAGEIVRASRDIAALEIVAVTPLNERVVTLLKLADGFECFASAPEESGASTRRHGPAFATLDRGALILFDRDSGQRIAPAAEARR